MSEKAHLLIIDDEKAIRNALRDILEHEKHSVDEAEDGAAGLEKAKRGGYDVILCDIKMPKMDGLEFLQKLMAHNDEVPVVMISGHGTIDTAVEALKNLHEILVRFEAYRTKKQNEEQP